MNRLPSVTHTRASAASVVERALGERLARDGEPGAFGSPRLVERVCAAIEKYCGGGEGQTSEDEITGFVGRLRLDELCLVVRCEAGEEAAWRELVEGFTPTVRSAARGACANETDAEELAASVWAELYGLRGAAAGDAASDDVEAAEREGAMKRKGKLAYYSGAGSLGGWLRAVVAQLAVDRHRRVRRLVQTEEAAEMERLEQSWRGDGARENHLRERAQEFRASITPTPEQAFAGEETAQLLAAALRRAVSELAAEDRLLLKLYYVDELRLREAGAALGFHEATASRRLSAVHKRLRESATAWLIAERKFTGEEVAALIRDEAASVQTDIRTLLQADDAPN